MAPRTILAITCLILCGCDLSPPANPFSQEVPDKTAMHRLALIYVPDGRGPSPNSEAFAFDSLAWRTKVGTNWSNRVVITKADFQAGNPRRRWVSGIHSLDAATGNAVIQVAEESPPQTNGATVSVACVYSCREWNLGTNREVRVLRICKKASEKF